jgi:predicted nucleic acid-binding protein
MLYLLDTTAVSELIREHPKLQQRVASLSRGDELCTCAVVRGEVLFGVERLPAGRRRDEFRAKVVKVLSTLKCEPVEPHVADEYAEMKSACERSGVQLNDNDLWIAATAKVLGARLISQDLDFTRVQGLDIEDWTR